MPSPYEDFFSFYRTDFLPAYTIVYDWIDYETVDINGEVVKILTSVANSFNSTSTGDGKERHLQNADQALRNLTVLCYYFYSLSFKDYFIDPIRDHPTTARHCISVGFELFQTTADKFDALLEKAQEATLRGEDPLRNDTISIYKEIKDLSFRIKGYIRETEIDRWKKRWKAERTQDAQNTYIENLVNAFRSANPKTFAQTHPFYFAILILIAGYIITNIIGPRIILPNVPISDISPNVSISNGTINTSLHPLNKT